MSSMSRIRIGISGWRYRGWRGTFYPKGLRQRDELAYAARHFNSIEINGTFYSLQRPDYFAAWAAEVPDGFVFSVKGPRFITHMKKLRDAEGPLANFFASGVLRLGAKLGPIFWQLPPRLSFDRERLETFFKLLPRTTAAAAELARRHDARMAGRTWLETDLDRPLRYGIEIRHDSFRDPAFIALLRAHDIGLVVADTVAWPLLMDVTSDFVYCRLHGSEQLYVSGYEPEALAAWAERATAWALGSEPPDAVRAADPASIERRPRDVFVYFDNDAKVRAPYDAMGLIGRVRERVQDPGSEPRPALPR